MANARRAYMTHDATFSAIEYATENMATKDELGKVHDELFDMVKSEESERLGAIYRVTTWSKDNSDRISILVESLKMVRADNHRLEFAIRLLIAWLGFETGFLVIIALRIAGAI